MCSAIATRASLSSVLVHSWLLTSSKAPLRGSLGGSSLRVANSSLYNAKCRYDEGTSTGSYDKIQQLFTSTRRVYFTTHEHPWQWGDYDSTGHSTILRCLRAAAGAGVDEGGCRRLQRGTVLQLLPTHLKLFIIFSIAGW